MFSKDQYFEYYYSHNRCIDDFNIRKHPYTQTQLETKYKKYVEKESKKYEKNKIQIDEKWQNIIKNLPNYCELIDRLKQDKKYSDIEIIRSKAGFLVNTIDGAHYKSRQKAPFMKYDSDNVVALNRYSHSNLDFMKHPIYGIPITQEEQESWWKYILGEERYNRLNKKFKEGGESNV